MSSGLDTKDKFLKLIYENFDRSDVSVGTLTDPSGYEIEIKAPKAPHGTKSYSPKSVTLSIYSDLISLHIDDFVWEYSDNYQNAYSELEKYLVALSKGRITKGGIKFINDHLEII